MSELTLRPFSEDELHLVVGKVVKPKAGVTFRDPFQRREHCYPRACVITHTSFSYHFPHTRENPNATLLYNLSGHPLGPLSAEDLLRDFTFIDGSPCGVPHSEKK